MPDWAWPLSSKAGARGLGGVLERAVALVEEEEVRVHVVGDVEVDLAVAVEVGRRRRRSRGRRSRPDRLDGRGLVETSVKVPSPLLR